MSEGIPEQGEKKMKTQFLFPWKVFGLEVFLFCLTLGLGILAAVQIRDLTPNFGGGQKITLPQISFWRFIISFLLATIFILLLVRFLKFKKGKGLIFKILFTLAVFFGGLLFLEVFLPEPIPLISISLLIF